MHIKIIIHIIYGTLVKWTLVLVSVTHLVALTLVMNIVGERGNDHERLSQCSIGDRHLAVSSARHAP